MSVCTYFFPSQKQQILPGHTVVIVKKHISIKTCIKMSP